MKKLVGNQSKLDLNKNGKLDSNDFKMLRSSKKMAKGGHVSKGEMVWNKLSSSDKIKFLYENFTPEITPRSQETLVGKSYNFLPKNVKIKMEAKYANVENYGNGGGTGVSSETGYAEGTNASLLMNQDYLAYAEGGGVGNDWFNKGVGTNGLNKIKEYSKQNPKLLFLVTDDNYSNIGSYYLLDGKFAKKTVANASYDLQKSKVNLKPKSDVIYKMKQLGDPNGYYANGGSLADTPESFPSTDAMSYKNGGEVEEDKIWKIIYKDKGVQKSILVEGYSAILEENNWKNKNPTKEFIQIQLYKNKMSMGGSTSGWCYSIGGL